MSTNTGIAWTDHTFNGWWGCQKVAQGCANCYAEVHAGRFYGRPIWGPAATTERRIMSDTNWNAPLKWDQESREHFELNGTRRRVFAMSMADALEDHPALVEPRKRFVALVENTPFLDWQILTKRPENHPMFGWEHGWPSNVWFGASMATQAEVLRNVPLLLNSPALVRFVSCEPIIEALDLRPFLAAIPGCKMCRHCGYRTNRAEEVSCPNAEFEDVRLVPDVGIDQVIAGGESAQRGRCRDCNIAWLEDLLEQCRDAGSAFFLKQMGSRAWTDNVNRWDFPDDDLEFESDGKHTASAFVHFKDPKGADPAEWPEHLRVQEFPR
jgi:protein gp37